MAKETTKALPSTEKSIQKPAGFDADAQLAAVRAITEDDFYEVERYDKKQGRTVKVKKPNARALQYEANKSGLAGISTKIVDAGVNQDQGWARVQGWPVNNPAFVKEEQVTITFSVELAQLLFDRIQKGCQYHTSGCPIVKDEKKQPIIDTKTGLPILEDGREQLQLISQIVRIKKFADRTCITKCEARLHEKFLNMEWREPEEVEHEAAEAAVVADAKKAQPVTEMPAAQNKPAEKAAEPAKAPATKPTTAPAKKTEAKAEPAEPVSQPPKANIPPSSTNKDGSPIAQEAPKPKVKDRAANLAVKTASSQTHVMQFMSKQIGVATITPEHVEQVKAVLTAAETLLGEGVPPFEFGAFIRGDNADPKIGERFKSLLYEGGA